MTERRASLPSRNRPAPPPLPTAKKRKASPAQDGEARPAQDGGSAPGPFRAAAAAQGPPSPGDITAPAQQPAAPDKGGGRRSGLWWKIVLALQLVLLPAVGAAAWSNAQPPTYAAEVDLLHEPTEASGTVTVDRQLATHEVLILRQPLIDDAARSVGRDPKDLTESIEVQAVGASSVLRIRVEDRDPQRAASTAAFVAIQYVSRADTLAASSTIGRMRMVAEPTILDGPVAPEPLRAGAAGLLSGIFLAVALVGLLRLRRQEPAHTHTAR